MKKMLKTTLALVLSLAMLICFAACDENKDTIIGKWEAQVDLSTCFEQGFKGASGIDSFNIDKMMVTVFITFNEDGTFEMEIPENSIRNALNNIRDDFEQILKSYIQALLDKEGSNISLNEYLETQNTSWNDLVTQTFEKMLEDASTDFNTKGVYKTESGKLFISETKDDFNDEEYEEYSIKGDELVLKSSTYTSNLPDDVYPITFKLVED